MRHTTLPRELRDILDPPEPTINPRARRARDMSLPYAPEERVTISIQFTGRLIEQIRALAQASDRSINGMVRTMLEEWLQSHR